MNVLLKDLVEADGVSGHEGAVRDVLTKAIEDRVDEYRVDALGNLIAVKYARGGAAAQGPRRVMIAAHMDEIGLMVTKVQESDGAVRFAPVGGIDPRVMLAKEVRIGDERIPGVIGVKPIHLLERSERERVLHFDSLAIDTGMGKEAARSIKVGTYVAFATAFEELASDGLRTVKGKAFDDRAGCAVLAELLKDDYPFDLYAAFTVQEEVGLRGARVAAYAVDPDIAFVLEGTVCDDSPKEQDVSPTTRLGAGPAMTFMDRSVICDRRLIKMMTTAAEAEAIPYQFKQPNIGGTDAGAIHMVRDGVPCAVLATPSRYIHSPVSVISLNDLDNALRLMRATLQRLQGGLVA